MKPDAGNQHVQAAEAPAAAATAPTVMAQTAPDVIPDRETITVLLKRGQELIAAGKFSEAREPLKIAAEAGSAPAALALGGTYDPTILQARAPVSVVVQSVPASTPRAQTDSVGPVTDPMADVAMAKAWYEKARDLGSIEAAVRLERLTSVPSPRR